MRNWPSTPGLPSQKEKGRVNECTESIQINWIQVKETINNKQPKSVYAYGLVQLFDTYITFLTELDWPAWARQNSSHGHPRFIPVRKVRFILSLLPVLVTLYSPSPPKDYYTDPQLLKW